MKVKKLVIAVLLLSALSACSSISEMMAEDRKAAEIQKAGFDKAVVGLPGEYSVVDGLGFDNGFGLASNYAKVKATVDDGQMKIVVLDKRDSSWKLTGQHCRGQFSNNDLDRAVTCDASVFYLDGFSQEFTMFKNEEDRSFDVFVTASKVMVLPVKKGDYVLNIRWKSSGRTTCFRLAKAS